MGNLKGYSMSWQIGFTISVSKWKSDGAGVHQKVGNQYRHLDFIEFHLGGFRYR
jgi:hypothetical protein